MAEEGVGSREGNEFHYLHSVNLSTCMIVQSPNQIETLYDKAADIMDNVHQTVFIGNGGQGEKPATKWVSNALGMKTIQAEQSVVIDEEQKERRRRDMEEDEKYDPVPREPVEPEVKPVQEVLQLGEMGNYEPAGCHDGERATVEELFDGEG